MHLTDDESDTLVQLEPVVRRVVARRVPASSVDDLVQDALERIIRARQRLTPESLVAYSVVVARSVIVGEHRRTASQQRAQPSMVDLREPEDPDAAMMAAEEHKAIRAALEQLSDADRDALVRHDVGGAGLADIALDEGSTPGAIATRLARARARLRVEYVLNIRRIELPTEDCQPVLLALSAGDRRRQRRLGADTHLLSCPPCAEVAPALIERRRGLALLAPLAILFARPRRWASEHPTATATAAAGGAVVAGALAYGALRDSPPPEVRQPPATASAPASTPDAPTTSSPATSACPELAVGGAAAPARISDLRALAGRTVTATDIPVESVPADEGFWIACGDQRLWVQLVVLGESPADVPTTDRVTFTGTLVPHEPAFPQQVGVTDEEGAQALATASVHIEVPAAELSAG